MTVISTNLYLEIAAGQTIVILPSGSALPADWEQAFSTFFDQQRALDLHLLSGRSEQASQMQSFGRWQITDIPAGRRGEFEIQVRVEVDRQGQVLIRARQAGRALPVSRLSAAPASLPVTQAVQARPAEGEANQSLDLRTLDRAEIKHLRSRGFEINAEGRLVAGRQPEKKGFFRRRKNKLVELSPEEIISLAGEPLPPEESQRCPNPKCRAVIHIAAERCEWCGRKLKA